MRIIKTLSVFLFCFFLIDKTSAQPTDSLKHKYINQTITPYGNYFLKGSERLVYKDLPNEFKISELAMASFKLAKRNRNTATVYRYLSLASVLASFSFIRSDRDLSFGLLGGSFVLSLFSSKHLIQYNQHLDKAIWQYNKDVLFPDNPR